MDIPLPTHLPDTRKGQNGKVLVVGGNEIFHGAPILAGLGAKKAGADLVTMVIPKKFENVVRYHSLHFLVHSFHQDYLNDKEVSNILELAQSHDVLLIGNGLGKKSETHKAVCDILAQIKILAVIDADGFFPEILKLKRQSSWILTPHDQEFERIFYCYASEGNIQEMTKEHQITILKKGHTDIIADSSGQFYENKTGVPQMTVGGTGDALAGIIAGFLSQGLKSFEAAKSAAFLWGKCGEHMAEDFYTFSAKDMLEVLPKIMNDYAP